MATTAVNPGTGTAAAGSGAGAAATSAAASSAAATSTEQKPQGAQATEQGAQQTQGTETSTEQSTGLFREGETTAETIARRMREKATQKAADEGQAATAAQGAEAAAAATEVAGKETVASKEEAETAAAKEGETAEGEQQTAETKTDEDLLADEDIALDEPTVLTPVELDKRLKENPALAEALNKDPQLKNELMRSLRLGAKAAEVTELVPTKQAAEYLVNQNQLFSQLQNDFVKGPEDPEATRRFIDNLYAQSVVIDPDTGEPEKNPDGSFKTDGSVEHFMGFLLHNSLQNLRTSAESSENARLLAAVDTIIEEITRDSTASDELTPDQKARDADLKRREQDLDRRQKEDRQRALQQSIADVTKAEGEALSRDIDRILDRYEVLDALQRNGARTQILTAFKERLDADRNYQQRLTWLKQQAPTKENLQQRRQLAREAREVHLMAVVRPILRNAGVKAVQTQTDRAAKVQAQVAASRSEMKGAGAAPTPEGAQNSTQALSEWEAGFKQKNNRPPTTLERTQFLVAFKRGAGR